MRLTAATVIVGQCPRVAARFVDNDLRPGRPFPQGSTWDGQGTNFSLFSEHAERVELCLFDEQGQERRVDVRDRTAFQWHVYVSEAGPGQPGQPPAVVE